MGVQAVAKLAQHVLAEPVRDDRLHDAESGRAEGDDEHDDRQQMTRSRSTPEPSLGNKPIVEDALNQQRVDDADDRARPERAPRRR